MMVVMKATVFPVVSLGKISTIRLHPMMRADGYQPQIVENEPTLSNDLYDGTTIYYYLTCCLSKLLFNANTSVRHCSNTTNYSDFNNTIICEDDNQAYPRKIKTTPINIMMS